MNKKKIIPISFESWNRYDKIYENTSFVIPLDKKLDNLFHNKLVSCLSFANGAIFGDPSSFLTPSKKAKLSWAYFPQDSRGFVCEIVIFSWRLYWWTTWYYLFHVVVKNHRDGTRFFIPLETSFFSQLRAKISKTTSIKIYWFARQGIHVENYRQWAENWSNMLLLSDLNRRSEKHFQSLIVKVCLLYNC